MRQVPDDERIGTLLADIVREIVNFPDDVRVQIEPDDRGYRLTIHVDRDDVGTVIGRRGRSGRFVR